MILRYRSIGDDVRRLQRALNAWGFGPLAEDGIFGRGTRSAVQQFQAVHGLTVDGVVGPNTWNALQAMQGPSAPAQSPTTPMVLPRKAELALRQAESLPAGMPRRLLEIAAVDIGKKEDPLGSNSGPEIAHLVDGYTTHWRYAAGSKPPFWCAMAVSRWIGYALDLPDPGPSAWNTPWTQLHPFGAWLGSAKAIEEWGKENQRFFAPSDAKPGDVFTMDRPGGGGHAGLVLRVLPEGVETIEANVSDSIDVRFHRFAELRGMVRVFDE